MHLTKFTFLLTSTGENIVKGLAIHNQRRENQCCRQFCSFPLTFTHCSCWCSAVSIASRLGNSLWLSSEKQAHSRNYQEQSAYFQILLLARKTALLYFFFSRVTGRRMPGWPVRERRSHRAVPRAVWHCNKEQDRSRGAGLQKRWMSAHCRKTRGKSHVWS